MLIGVISDTHGLLRPEALAALAGVDHILHAGDIGNPDILASLREIAPVTAICGNVDTIGDCALLPETEAVELANHLIYLVHSIHDLDVDPEAASIDMVISGHSHQPKIETRNAVIYLNPGSAGPRRFNLPVTLVLVTLTKTEITPRLIKLLP